MGEIIRTVRSSETQESGIRPENIKTFFTIFLTVDVINFCNTFVVSSPVPQPISPHVPFCHF